MTDQYDFLFKCVVLGDGGCGKTAIVVRFSQGFFKENYKMTIGVEFAVKSIEVKNAQNYTYNVKLQIWDTGGQDRFQYVRPLYYKGAMGCIILFDITNRESFDHIPRWIEEIRKEAGEIPTLLVGNKSDLQDQRVVSRKEAEKLAKKLGFLYAESSAKNGVGVGDIFKILALMMIGEEVPKELIEDNLAQQLQTSKTPFSESKTQPSPFGITSKPFNIGETEHSEADQRMVSKPKPAQLYNKNSSGVSPKSGFEPIKVKPSLNFSSNSLKVNPFKSSDQNTSSTKKLDDIVNDSSLEAVENQGIFTTGTRKTFPKPQPMPSQTIDSELFIPKPPPNPHIPKVQKSYKLEEKSEQHDVYQVPSANQGNKTPFLESSKEMKSTSGFDNPFLAKKESESNKSIIDSQDQNPFISSSVKKDENKLNSKFKDEQKKVPFIFPTKSIPSSSQTKPITKSTSERSTLDSPRKSANLQQSTPFSSKISSSRTSSTSSLAPFIPGQNSNEKKSIENKRELIEKNLELKIPAKTFTGTINPFLTPKSTMIPPVPKKPSPNPFIKQKESINPKQIVCPNCGNVLPRKFKYCNKCGALMKY
ncbi:MAG: GTP-binding protein [Candidatus Lokiarchaeota archaeon]|nr:GTP-binding protein [Candidatus Harpocratesius repetitus]